MEPNNKLYKCYKPGCNKADDSDNPFLTQSEYDELMINGKLICPENHEACGIQELKPEDYPRPPKDHKKLFLIGGGSLSVIIIVVAILFFTTKSKVEQATDVAKVVDKVATSISNSSIVGDKGVKGNTEVPSSTQTVDKKETEGTTGKPAIKTEPVGSHQPTEPVIVEHATVKNDFGYYEGPTKNGLAHGQGIFYFNQRHVINPKDPEERYAEAGEYVSGVFHDGYLVNGKLFGKDKQQKAALFIGQ